MALDLFELQRIDRQLCRAREGMRIARDIAEDSELTLSIRYNDLTKRISEEQDSIAKRIAAAEKNGGR
jgi:hypothetical protein